MWLNPVWCKHRINISVRANPPGRPSTSPIYFPRRSAHSHDAIQPYKHTTAIYPFANRLLLSSQARLPVSQSFAAIVAVTGLLLAVYQLMSHREIVPWQIRAPIVGMVMDESWHVCGYRRPDAVFPWPVCVNHIKAKPACTLHPSNSNTPVYITAAPFLQRMLLFDLHHENSAAIGLGASLHIVSQIMLQ